MPHIEIKCFKGRTEEQKKECAKKLAQVVSETMGCNLSSISVKITEFDKEDWKPLVWDKDIEPNMDVLYKKPEYKC